jgi:hypothetical protein
MGIDKFSDMITRLCLRAKVPDEIDLDKPVDVFQDMMTHLYSMTYSGRTYTGISLYQEFIAPHRDQLQRVYEKNKDLQQYLVLCGDREKLKPVEKGKEQKKRDDSKKSTRPKPLEKTWMGKKCEHKIGDDGLYFRQVDREWSLTGEFHISSIMDSRDNRYIIFDYFLKKLIADKTIPPNTKIVFDCRDSGIYHIYRTTKQASILIEKKSEDPFVGLSSYEYGNEKENVNVYVEKIDQSSAILFGEADLSVTRHVVESVDEGNNNPIVVFATDTDITALLIAHLMKKSNKIKDIPSIHQPIKGNISYTSGEAYNIKTIINTLLSAKWTPVTFLTTCLMMGTDYVEKLKGVGHHFILSACVYFNQRQDTKEFTKEHPDDDYLPLDMLRALVSFIWCAKSKVPYGSLGIDSRDATSARLFRSYIGNMKYWMHLDNDDSVNAFKQAIIDYDKARDMIMIE